MLTAAAPPAALAALPTAPWLVPVVVVLVVAGAALLAAALGARVRRPAEHSAPAPAPGDWRRFPDDDLPGFAEFPPGVPGRQADEQPPTTVAAQPSPPTPAGAGRLLTAGGAAVLVAATALTVAAAHADPASSSGQRQTSRSAEPDPPPPSLPPLPAAPAAGEAGAGALADATVPLGRHGTAATLRFGGIVLEPRAVGLTVTYPQVTVSVGGSGAAVAHVRLPTFNCLTTEPPADPLAAGCVASLEEDADLPTPALSVDGEAGGGLRVSGRFPTYTRPNGTPPAYTGHVYELTFTASPSGTRQDGEAPATGELFLGAGRTATVGNDGVNVLRFGG